MDAAFTTAKWPGCFFGGHNGFNLIDPEHLAHNKRYAPEVVFTDFQLFNKQVPIGQNAVLKKSITQIIKVIKLIMIKSVFTIEFSALNFTLPKMNSYAYKLENSLRKTGITRRRAKEKLLIPTLIPENILFLAVKAGNKLWPVEQ